MKKWQKISSQYLFKTSWLSLRKDAYQTPEGKIIDDYYIVERDDFVVIVPKTNDGKYVLIKQYRQGPDKEIWNFPMGYIKRGETPNKAAYRELTEELDCKNAILGSLGNFLLAPSFTTMQGYVFLATNIGSAKKMQKGIDPDGEIIQIKVVNKREIEAMINKKAQTDFTTVCAYLLERNHSR